MPSIPAPKDQWYVIHVLSGQELKVRDSIERRIAAEELGDVVFEVLVPQERVSEVKSGQKREADRKFFPGYIIVNMHLLHEDNTLAPRKIGIKNLACILRGLKIHSLILNCLVLVSQVYEIS